MKVKFKQLIHFIMIVAIKLNYKQISNVKLLFHEEFSL